MNLVGLEGQSLGGKRLLLKNILNIQKCAYNSAAELLAVFDQNISHLFDLEIILRWLGICSLKATKQLRVLVWLPRLSFMGSRQGFL